MDGTPLNGMFKPDLWYHPGKGPRYLQLYRYISGVIGSGQLEGETQLPTERDLADLADVSRVTVRNAVARLVQDGLVEQRRGSGTYVRPALPKFELALSTLTSFTEYMRQRGRTSTSQILQRGLFAPSPDEQLALGLSSTERVSRIERLRSADGTPMAIERSSLPQDILPNPELVETSLYSVLREAGLAPVRAVQRITAVNLSFHEGKLLMLAEGAAALRIDRTGYLPSGRPIEFTRGLYRSDLYDFVAELRMDEKT
jgi:GntR family transcriptional regulator